MGEVVAFPARAEPDVDPVSARNKAGLAEARAALRRGRARALERSDATEAVPPAAAAGRVEDPGERGGR